MKAQKSPSLPSGVTVSINQSRTRYGSDYNCPGLNEAPKNSNSRKKSGY